MKIICQRCKGQLIKKIEMTTEDNLLSDMFDNSPLKENIKEYYICIKGRYNKEIN